MINLVLDYDGTLHDAIQIYAPSFRKAQAYLAEKGLVDDRPYSDQEISRWLGFTASEMWQDFAPDLPRQEKETCMEMIGSEMVFLTNSGRAVLYPKTEETLSFLKKEGFMLIFLSNCKTAYCRAHRKAFALDRFFSDFYCSEEFGYEPKHEIFRKIQKDWPGEYIIIGDRYQDMRVAQEHHLCSVGCTYGYGTSQELESANVRIDHVGALRDLSQWFSSAP